MTLTTLAWLALAAYGFHIMEEFTFDWRNWARAAIGLPVEWSDFYVTNAIVIALLIVQAELAAYKSAGVNPWSISYNPLRDFRSTTTREAVTAEYLATREEAHALTSEDSGSEWLSTAGHHTSAPRFFAGR